MNSKRSDHDSKAILERYQEYKYFGEKTIQELDAEVDYLEMMYERNCRIKLCGVLIFLAFLFREPIIFHIKYAFPVPTTYTSVKIDPYQEPIQNNIETALTKQMKANDGEVDIYENPLDTSEEDIAYINEKKPPEIFTMRTTDNHSDVKLIAMAEYSISGRAIAMNHTFNFSGSAFDHLALFDLGLSWGYMSPTEYLKRFVQSKSEKVHYNGARMMSSRFINFSESPLSFDYLRSHESHTHIIPSNSNILSALLKIKKYELVKVDGLLVDLIAENHHIKGSLSRVDAKEGRGSGNCEIMYVTSVQIGNAVYE